MVPHLISHLSQRPLQSLQFQTNLKLSLHSQLPYQSLPLLLPRKLEPIMGIRQLRSIAHRLLTHQTAPQQISRPEILHSSRILQTHLLQQPLQQLQSKTQHPIRPIPLPKITKLQCRQQVFKTRLLPVPTTRARQPLFHCLLPRRYILWLRTHLPRIIQAHLLA